MSLCTSCNYPVPSWQHNGACKPVAEKVPPLYRFFGAVGDATETAVTNPSPAALRQREARERKKRGQ